MKSIDALKLIERMKDQHTTISTTCHVDHSQLESLQAAIQSHESLRKDLWDLADKWRNPKWEANNDDEQGFLECLGYCAAELQYILDKEAQ